MAATLPELQGEWEAAAVAIVLGDNQPYSPTEYRRSVHIIVDEWMWASDAERVERQLIGTSLVEFARPTDAQVEIERARNNARQAERAAETARAEREQLRAEVEAARRDRDAARAEVVRLRETVTQLQSRIDELCPPAKPEGPFTLLEVE